MRTVQVLEEMATAQGVQSILGDFPDPSGNNPEQPDLSRPCLKKEIGLELSWGPFQPELFCDYPEGTLYGTNGTAVFCSHHLKNPKTQQKQQPKNPHKNILWKDRVMNRLIHPQNRMKNPFPLKGSSPSCCQPCKMRNKHRRALFAASEETLNRGFSLAPLIIPQAYPSLCMEGFFPFGSDFFFFKYINFDHYHLIWQDLPQGLFQNHDHVFKVSPKEKGN